MNARSQVFIIVQLDLPIKLINQPWYPNFEEKFSFTIYAITQTYRHILYIIRLYAFIH